jgi:hypothetical protein
VWIECGGRVRVYVDHRHRYAPMSRRFYKSADLDLCIKPKQGEVRTQRITRARFRMRSPGVAAAHANSSKLMAALSTIFLKASECRAR